jgi:hypothetical protein
MNLRRKVLAAEKRRTDTIGKVNQARKSARITWEMYVDGLATWEEVERSREKVRRARTYWLQAKDKHEQVQRAEYDEVSRNGSG